MPPAPEPSSRLSGNESSRLSRRPAVVPRASPSGPLTIFCGAHEPITLENILESDYDEHRPGMVQILPETLSFALPSVYKEARTTRSTGCGALVHGAVSLPRWSQSRTVNPVRFWYGEEENVADTVVPLDKMYFPQRLWEILDLRGNGTAVCGGNPLGAVQTHCSTHSFCGSTALPKGGTYIFAPSAVTPRPSLLLLVPDSNAPASASSDNEVEPAPPTTSFSPAPPPPATLVWSDFAQSTANGSDEFDTGLFRGDTDINFERDFAQWFNDPDDVGMSIGDQNMPSTTPTSIRFSSSTPSSGMGTSPSSRRRPRARARYPMTFAPPNDDPHRSWNACQHRPPLHPLHCPRGPSPARPIATLRYPGSVERHLGGGRGSVQPAGPSEHRDDHGAYIPPVIAGSATRDDGADAQAQARQNDYALSRDEPQSSAPRSPIISVIFIRPGLA
ncbi:hypothetical protein GGX14DRAFT_603853 [Mycena pura]|uniref:Uncharacterized protein n=1 Tax=Mycena pura TaxID=153505 RepID=A0AAD6UMS3_9AGAR|nr:hypothetical protein GGX14DRAFT_603853 [Mycena pura]